MTHPDASIAVFDSGVGGLTVFRALKTLLPHENILYFADTAHLPYGNKTPETIISYSLQAAEFFSRQHIKILVIACHTACAAAIDPLRSALSIPVIAILEQAVEQLLNTPSKGEIALLGTATTLQTGVFQKQIAQKLPSSKLISIACPLFVPLVEEGLISHPLTQLAVKEHLAPLKTQPVDTLLLGCTHYPFLHQIISQEIGPEILLLDPAEACAQHVRAFLAQTDLLNPQTTPPTYQFYVSAAPEKFSRTTHLLMGEPLDALPVLCFESHPINSDKF